MHKLVCAWDQQRLKANKQRPLSCLVLELLADAITQDQIYLSYKLRLISHVMTSFSMFSLLHKPLNTIEIGRLAVVDKIAGFLYKIGRWSEAYDLQVFYFTKVKKMLGEEHPSTLISMNNLTKMLSSQGKYKEAERISRQTLALRERVLSKDHPNTLASMNNLAEKLSGQGKYKAAEQIHEQVIVLRKMILGNEHPNTLASMNNLAESLSGQDKYKEAEQIHEQVMILRKEILGNEHRDTLMSMSNLARALSNQSEYGKAEMRQLQALSGRRKALGVDHPDVFRSLSHLAFVMVWSFQDRNKNESVVLEYYHSALEIAASYGHQKLVQLLLNERANVTILEEHYESALQAASAAGHETIVSLLLKKGADVNASSGQYGSALQAASAAGHETIVSLLLKKGAHIDASGGQHGSALQAAVKGGHENVTQTLLFRGVGSQFEHEQGITLLHAAAASGNARIVRLLIDRGALETTRKTEIHAEDERSTISDPSVSTMDSKMDFGSSLTSQAVCSVTSAYGAAPDDVFTVLVDGIFETAVVKDICEKILDKMSESDTIRLLGIMIKDFCSDLIDEGPNELRSNSIRLLRRHCGFFAFAACQACRLSDGRHRGRTLDLSKLKLGAESNVEKYLRES